jgi:hypothetical protein
VESADGPIQQGPNNGFGRRAPGQLLQVPLDDGGGGFFGHGNPQGRGDSRIDYIAEGVLSPRFRRMREKCHK